MKDDSLIEIALVGIGGYGNVYLEKLLNEEINFNYKITGVVDPQPKKCKNLLELKKMNIPIFSSIKDFFNNYSVDLTIISSPLHYHVPHTRLALINNSNVLCEKPLAPTVREAHEMIELDENNENFVSIGYQWSFSNAIQELKKDISKGLFGNPKRFKTIILWPRDHNYYKRANWAGKIHDDNGRWILDSISNNATAHFIHNMFYVLGEELNKSAYPEFIEAELYRANDIETFDTSVCRILTRKNVELLYYASHAVKKRLDPSFCFEFEKANVVYGEYEGFKFEDIIAMFNNGTSKNYGDPEQDKFNKLNLALEATINSQKEIPCIPETAFPQTLTVNGMQQSVPDIIKFSEEMIKIDQVEKINWVKGLAEELLNCYKESRLPNEKNFDWAKNGDKVNISNYKAPLL